LSVFSESGFLESQAQGAIACQCPKAAQQYDRLFRQRDPMRAAHLHFLGWNRPKRAVQIDLGPFGASQFAGPHKGQCEQLQSKPNFRHAVIVVDRSEQSAEGLRLDDCGAVANDGRGQGAA
jgi:hypothetical protein